MGQFLAKIQNLFGKRKVKILLAGLDAAGKTSILYYLKLGEKITAVPTIGFNLEECIVNNLNFTLYDVGGGDKLRVLLFQYFMNLEVFIYVVDISDKERLQQSKKEFYNSVNHKEFPENTIIMFFLNKCDLKDTISNQEFIETFDIVEKIEQKYNWSMKRTSAVTGEGIMDGLTWVADALKAKDSKSYKSH